jgi:Tol biopolymer transport system component
VFIVQSDGTGAYELSWGSSEESSPSWSPDGSMMTYAAKDGTSYNIVVFTVDYQDILHVSYNSSDNKMPHWNYGAVVKIQVVGP